MKQYFNVMSNIYPKINYLNDKVFVPSNIIEEIKDDEIIYTYDETEYTNAEYLEFLTNKQVNTENELSNVLLACAELYETLGVD